MSEEESGRAGSAGDSALSGLFAPGADAWSRLRATGRPILRWLRSGPVSIVLTLLLVAAYVVALTASGARLEATPSTGALAGVGHAWWAAFVSFSWARSVVRLLIESVLMLTVGIWLERLLGSRWFLLVGALTYAIGASLTFGVVRLIDAVDHQWGALLLRQQVMSSLALLMGVVSAASVKMPAVWRRRMRIEVGVILLMMVVFSGTVGTLFTLVSAAAGLGLGFLLWGRERDPRPPVASGLQDSRILIALVVAGIVVGTLVSLHLPGMIGALVSLRYSVTDSAVLPPLIDHVCDAATLQVQCSQYQVMLGNDYLGRRILAIIPLVLQLILTWGLYRGRAAAWNGTMILQGASVVVAMWRLFILWRGMHVWQESAVEVGFNQRGYPGAQVIVPIVVPLIMLAIVGANRALFRVRAARGVYPRLGRNLAWVTLVTWLVALAVGLARMAPGDLGKAESVTGFLGQLWGFTVGFVFELLPSSVLSVVTPGILGRVHAAGVWGGLLPLVPWLALSVMLWRSFQTRRLPGLISREEYMEVLRSTHAGSMGWSGTWAGNYYWRSPSCEAAIAYRVEAGVALTVSNPAARREDLERVLTEFAGFCQEQGLVPGLYSVHPEVVRITDSWNWTHVQVAEETILDLHNLELKGKKFQDIRTALNRAQREGIRAEWTTWGRARPELLAQIKQISADWMAGKALPEMGFTIGGMAELDDPEVRILLAVDQQGIVQGVTSWMPIYDDGRVTGWILDFMRRLDGGFRPVMEYLIASAALWAREEGYDVLSLSGVPLVKVGPQAAAPGGVGGDGPAGEAPSPTVLEQLLDLTSHTLEPVYGFHSLLNFKAKFDPTYVPMYLVIPSMAALPAAGLALLRVFLPGMGLADIMKMGLTLRQR